MKISCFPVNPFVECTYILWTHDRGEAAIVDPGMMNSAEREMVDNFINQHSLTVKHVLLTHIHIDHVTSARWCASRYGVDVECSREEEPYGDFIPQQAMHFRLNLDVEALTIDKYLSDNDSFTIGGEKVIVLSTPGHSAGSLSYYVPESSFVVTGDALFAGSIGRTDLPGGNFDVLISSIQDKLLTLPHDTMVYPGHGPATTIGDELRYNPYL